MVTQPPWSVRFTAKAKKQSLALPARMQTRLIFLAEELARCGPTQPSFEHYGKLLGRGDVHHCHLNAGRPRWVVVWEVLERELRILEIQYVGTHEKAPY